MLILRIINIGEKRWDLIIVWGRERDGNCFIAATATAEATINLYYFERGGIESFKYLP